MAYQFPPDVERLIRGYMASGSYTSEDEVLRDALQTLGEFVHSKAEFDEEYHQTVAAVREGMADAEAGKMRPLRAVIDESRGEHSVETE